MGYTTKFVGGFALNRELTHREWMELKELASYDEDVYKRYTSTPDTIPTTYNQWTTNEDGTMIIFNGGEKFYDYVHWLRWIVKHYLKPRNLTIDGSVTWQGEKIDDVGIIFATDNRITSRKVEVKGVVTCPNCDHKFVAENV
jgi:hypothetical protein